MLLVLSAAAAFEFTVVAMMVVLRVFCLICTTYSKLFQLLSYKGVHLHVFSSIDSLSS
jgi:hypothetical protein